jgi:hypothetical protein
MRKIPALVLVTLLLALSPIVALAAGDGGAHHVAEGTVILPMSLEDYKAAEAAKGIDTLAGVLKHRVQETPFNLVATIIFLLAVIHTFMAGSFQKLAHKLEHQHREKMQALGRTADEKGYHNAKDETSFSATICHFLGEVEAIFGIWCVPLLLSILFFFGWGSSTYYIDNVVNYTEPMFVVVIMAIASTRPVLKFSEKVLGAIASFGGRSPKAWWYSILIVAPLLGSFITEPAAMTIAALLLAKTIYTTNRRTFSSTEPLACSL